MSRGRILENWVTRMLRSTINISLMSLVLQYRTVSSWPESITGSSARELADNVEDAVRSGILKPSQELPSVRRLAVTLSLSPATVAGAMGILRQRGIVESQERRSTRIASGKLGSTQRPVVDLRHGCPDVAHLPDIRTALRRAAEEITSPRSYGLSPIDADLAALAAERFSADGIDASHLLACGGALDGILRALEVTLSPGDVVAVEDPGYSDHYDLVRAIGMRTVPVTVDDEGPHPESLRSALSSGAKAFILTPAGQNPRGSWLSAERASQLRAVLLETPDVLVLEDQHLSFMLDRTNSVSAGGLRRWLVVRSLAKSLGPDLRLAIAAGDATTIAAVSERIAVGPGWISHILQRTAVALLTAPAVQLQLLDARQAYDSRRDRLLEALSAFGVEAFGRSGLNVWIPVEDEGSVAMALAEDGWGVTPGHVFRLSSPPAIRITTSTLPEHDARRVAEAVARSVFRRPARRA